MSFSIETVSTISSNDLETAASLTAGGFGRNNNNHNLIDTRNHLSDADYVQFMRDGDELVAFAAYKSLLWQHSN
jgi:hypothetical protein